MNRYDEGGMDALLDKRLSQAPQEARARAFGRDDDSSGWRHA